MIARAATSASSSTSRLKTRECRTTRRELAQGHGLPDLPTGREFPPPHSSSRSTESRPGASCALSLWLSDERCLDLTGLQREQKCLQRPAEVRGYGWSLGRWCSK